MPEDDRRRRFETAALPWLDAAYNLARWLTRNPHDAEDVVQEAYLRAFRYFDGFKGGDARPWLLSIVRHTAYSWLQKRGLVLEGKLGDRLDDHDGITEDGDTAADPETQALSAATREQVRAALEALPCEFREVLVLRELEDMSYKEIAAVAGIPMGTVMSRLARGRKLLRANLVAAEGPRNGM